ncbi:MAG: SUMF1/EgtB/PvdO family nonheme iron enzyme [Phycisphaerae bacterium]|nr:SUMF1/EgtB/PvdO family nonheme iron enzyme [Phycisphaerae bacterium]
MTPLAWLDVNLCSYVVKVLAHSLWQGTVVALLLALATGVLRRASAQSRYVLSVGALFVQAACPIVTLLVLWFASKSMTSTGPAPWDAKHGSASELVVQNPDRLSTGAVDYPATGRPTNETPVGVATERPAQRGFLGEIDWDRYAPYTVSLYFFGVAAFLGRFLLACHGGHRLRRDACPVDDPAILSALARQAKLLRLSFTPGVAYCRQVLCPTVVGAIRPTILLPVSLLSGLTPEQVEVVLAHELAHIRRYDHLVNLLQRLIEAFLFFHPAVWYVTRRVRDEREHCCDDLVLTTGTRPLDYAGALVHVARAAHAVFTENAVPGRAAAVAMMGNPSRLRHRITRLTGQRALGPLRLTRTSGSLVILIAVGVLAAGAYLGAQPAGRRASASSAPEVALTEPADLTVEVVDAETQQPIAQAEVIAEGPHRKELAAGKTDETGKVRLKLPAVRSGRKPRRPFVRVQAQGYTTMGSYWTAQWFAKGPLRYEMPRSERYGGFVRDREGNGIEGVEVQISSYVSSPVENNPFPFLPGLKAKTDASGKWTTNLLPARDPDFGIQLSHPGYFSDSGPRGTGRFLEELRAGTAVMILKKAARLTGRVADADGKPVPSAAVRLGDLLADDFPATGTNDQGMFIFESVLPGPQILTVQHPNYAPALLKVEAGKDTEPIRVVLRPGGIIAGRVVDKDGQGLVGIRLRAYTWRGHRTLDMGTMTLTDGRFTLKNCPKEPIGFTIQLADLFRSADRQYMARFDYPLQPRTEPYRIVLHPPLVITGKVVDGETGKPIDEFAVIPKTPGLVAHQAQGLPVEAKRFREGRYEMSFTYPRGQRRIRVEADGYAPAVSRLYKDDEGEQVFDFELKKSTKGKPAVLDLGNDVKLELVLIPPGEFMMGSPEDGRPRQDREEKPQHRVRIAKPFYMGKYEVTQRQWQAVMGQNPSHFTGSDDLPVEEVSWEDCQAFCKKASAKVGMTIRLPSEAEWEYACRAGTRTRYSYGDAMHPELGQYGWYDANSEGKTHRVGRLKPNPWGLYDMHGNLSEWCQDVYHKGYEGAPADGSAWVSDGDEGGPRVVRGGTWWSFDSYGCRSSQRGGGRPDGRSPLTGFRVAAGIR